MAVIRATVLHGTWKDLSVNPLHPSLYLLQTPHYVHKGKNLEVLEKYCIRDLGVVGFGLEKELRVWGSTPRLVSTRALLIFFLLDI